MFHRDSIRKFLVDRKVEPPVALSIKARMRKVVDKDGMFDTALLEEVMGSYNLSQAYLRAWSRDPSLKASCFQSRKYPPSPPKPSQ